MASDTSFISDQRVDHSVSKVGQGSAHVTCLLFLPFVEKTYLLHFFEVGSHNDLLHKLYAVMCDVFVVAVDSTNPMASQDALLMLDKIRCLPLIMVRHHSLYYICVSKRCIWLCVPWPVPGDYKGHMVSG